MSQQERDRLHWLKQARERKITQRQAAERMGVSERWVRELLRRMKQEGDRVVVHGLRGRPSNRKIPELTRRKAVEIVRREYRDFGPTLAAEYLAEHHEIRVGKETLRQWLIEAKLWRAKQAQIGEVHLWRPRRSSAGELVQWDTSDHDWLEGRGPRIYLIAMIDDATSRALARFAEHDTTEENMRLLERYLRRWGRPVGAYTDKNSMFFTSPKQALDGELPPPMPTQIGRALKELGIVWQAAHSPQAKGRVERFFGTAQDRLVKGLRKAGARSLEEANRYLEQVYLPLWNERFTVEAAHPADAHRPLLPDQDLAAILSHVETRRVTNDYTFRWLGGTYQIARDDVQPRMRKARVRVERRLDGTLAVRFQDRYVNFSECVGPPPEAVPAARNRKPAGPRAKSRWMRDFDLHDSRPLWTILQQEQGKGTPR